MANEYAPRARPWSVEASRYQMADGGRGTNFYIKTNDLPLGDGGTAIAVVCNVAVGEHAEFIAHHIVTCVNTHDELVTACEAAQQCITDLVELYKRGGSFTALDEAVRSCRDDALQQINAVLAKEDHTAPRG